MRTSIDTCVNALTRIGAHPSAPFYEWRTAAYISSELQRMGIDPKRDSYGNIIATYEGPGESDGDVAFVAHMDHPAFELSVVDPSRGRLIGGVRKECFNTPVPVRVFPALPPKDAPDCGVPGSVVGYELTEEGIDLKLQMDAALPEGPAFGVWDIPEMEARDGRAYMRAADDLAGCAAILLAMERVVEAAPHAHVHAVFTRAEEAGLVGAIQVARERLLPDDTIVVSFETSKELPGAEMGAGPVVRVGDRLSTFDMSAEMLLRSAWNRIAADDPSVKVQRQLMSGGTCEGTIFRSEGYRTTAIALPLGNYHNVGLHLTIEPEYIHLGDMATAVDLLARSAILAGEGLCKRGRQVSFPVSEEQVNKLFETHKDWPTL